jgi:hypothetical protein
MSGGGGQQGAAAPAQGGANVFSGSTNPTPYQGSAAQQNLGQATGAQGFNGNSPVSAGYQQIQNNAMQGALGAVSAPAGGGQNAMGPNIFGGGTNPAAGGGQDMQGQNAMGAPMQAGPNVYGGGLNPQGMPPQSGTAMTQGFAGQGGGTQGYAHSGAMQYNPQGPQGAMPAPTFTPQSPMGGFPQPPQGGGPDMTGNYPSADMGFDRSGNDAGIGGKAVQGVQNPAGIGKMEGAGGPYGGIMAGRPAMDKGEMPPSLSQMRPQVGGLQIQGNPSSQPFIRSQRMRQPQQQ